MRITFYIFLLVLISCSDRNRSDDKITERHIEIIQREDSIDLDIIHGYDTFKNQEVCDLNNLGIEYIRNNDYKAAEKEFIAAFRLEPNNPTILNNLGNIYQKIGTEKMALEYYTDSFKSSDSTYINAAYNMGISYCNLKEYEKSEEVLKYVLNHTNDETWQMLAKYTLSRLYLNQNRCEEAKEIYQVIKTDLNHYSKLKLNQKKFEIRLENCVQQSI
mgnify:FL=1